MAKVHGKDFGAVVNAVNFADYVRTVSLGFSADTAEVTTPNDGGNKTYLEGNLDATISMAGPADFASGTSDATLFALFGGGAVTVAAEPDNDAATSATNPTYSQSAILTGYTLNFDVNADINWDATFQRTGATTRSTS
jgi:hypothetical protein